MRLHWDVGLLGDSLMAVVHGRLGASLADGVYSSISSVRTQSVGCPSFKEYGTHMQQFD